RGDRSGLRPARLAHDELALFGVDHDGVALTELAVQNGHRERILNPTLDHALERPGAVGRVVALVRDELQSHRGELQADPPLRQSLPQSLELDVDDRLDLFTAQRLEDDDLIDAIEEFRTEV